MQALDALRPAAAYELADTFFPAGSATYPAYVRGVVCANICSRLTYSGVQELKVGNHACDVLLLGVCSGYVSGKCPIEWRQPPRRCTPPGGCRLVPQWPDPFRL